MVLLKGQFSNLYFCVCSLMWKEAPCQFSFKNVNIWAPWNFLKMKTLTRMHRQAAWALSAHRNFGIGLLKSYLTFGHLTCSVRSKTISTLHPSDQGNLIKICVGDFLKIKLKFLKSFCSNLIKIRAFLLVLNMDVCVTLPVLRDWERGLWWKIAAIVWQEI